MDELDAALDGLESTEDLDRADTEEVPVEPATPPPRPAVRKSITPDSYESREPFPTLFENDPTPAAVARATPEEKIQNLRSKLKFAENQIARFRTAWETREAELDAVEELLARARDGLSTIKQDHEMLQKEHREFVESTQRELKQRGREVERLRWERDKANEKVTEVSEEEVSSLRRQIDGLKYELEEKQTELERVTRQLGERDIVLRGVKSELEARDDEMSRLQMALRAASQMGKRRED